MPATADRPKADRTILPLLSRSPLLQEREHHYRRGSRTRGRPREGEEERVRCQLGRSSTVQADLTVGCRRAKGRQKPRSASAEDGEKVTIFRMPTVPTEQLRRECNTREQGHQGNYFTDSQRLASAYWRWKEGCRPCKPLSEMCGEVRGKGEKHQRKHAVTG